MADGWTRSERRVLDRLRTPIDVQELLDRLPYLTEDGANSPRETLRLRRAQCFGGAVFGAAALERLGHPPLLVDLVAENDDDHVLAVFRERGRWGACSKSNFVTLRYREPVYRSLRELVMSYFDFYFNLRGEKSLRQYSRPLDLRRYDRDGWRVAAGRLRRLEEDIFRVRHYRLLPDRRRPLARAPRKLVDASTLDADPDGLYRP
jgi:hypothetical protein